MQEEIKLRDLIEVIIKGKKLIIAIMIIFVLLATTLSYLVIKPTYETKATILVNNLQIEEGDEISAYLNEVISPQVYSERITSQHLLNRVIDNHSLDNEWDVKTLKEKLTVETEKDSKILIITLQGNDPKIIKKTLEAIIKEANEFIGESISKRLLITAEQYKEQTNEEKEKLEEVLKRYNAARVDEDLPTIVLLDALISGQKQYLLDVDEKYLDELQSLDKNKQVEFQKLNNQVNTLTTLFNEYNAKYEKARSVSQLFNVENELTVVSGPELPLEPISPKKARNIVTSLVLGFMAGVGVVFFRYYLDQTKKGSN
ncbi:Wzz/FepE/Etk N-terminal domain-containing protein [Mesobacillus jeotgali]|uniref:Wzz/FepE/Etk N-terminal domain-containing protein n=1 Tax=Mesobacillus jeotgali TaxID=129985 RepID=UPI0009A6660F|nr:Wzz/FepE/Etk N-terminal domain-containing protein [Mesobacillus jeotgali]